MNLSGLGSVANNGNANNPDGGGGSVRHSESLRGLGCRYVHADSTFLTRRPLLKGAYSTNGGTSWTSLGQAVAPQELDIVTVNANPPTELIPRLRTLASPSTAKGMFTSLKCKPPVRLMEDFSSPA